LSQFANYRKQPESLKRFLNRRVHKQKERRTLSKMENIKISEKSMEAKNRSKLFNDYSINYNDNSTFVNNNETFRNQRLLNMSVDDYETYIKPVMNRRNNHNDSMKLNIKSSKRILKSQHREKSTSSYKHPLVGDAFKNVSFDLSERTRRYTNQKLTVNQSYDSTYNTTQSKNCSFSVRRIPRTNTIKRISVFDRQISQEKLVKNYMLSNNKMNGLRK
jgi:hypothetical protein